MVFTFQQSIPRDPINALPKVGDVLFSSNCDVLFKILNFQMTSKYIEKLCPYGFLGEEKNN